MKSLRRVFFLVLGIGLLVSPFVFWPRSPVPYEIPRVWFIQWWIALLVGTGLVTCIMHRRANRLQEGIVNAYCCFCALV